GVRALHHADGAAERQPEHAETVGHADAEMDGERGWRHEPAVVARVRDDALFIEQADPMAGGFCTCRSRHVAPPREIGLLVAPCICKQFDRAWQRSQGFMAGRSVDLAERNEVSLPYR